MKEVKVSTRYSASIKLKSKTFILFLRTPERLEVYGPDINPAFPMIIKFNDNKTEKIFKYDEEDFWNSLKNFKKMIKKKKK